MRKELKIAKYDRRLPEGIVLVGGGAKLKDIEIFAKEIMETSVKVGVPKGLGGVADAIEKPEYATAVGLAMMAADENGNFVVPKKAKAGKKAAAGFFVGQVMKLSKGKADPKVVGPLVAKKLAAL